MATGHLFLSYSSRDRDKVRSIRTHLEARGVRTFFDESSLRVGQNWAQALEQALKESLGVAVFVGQQIGNWQWPEIGFALDRQANDKAFPVIPVLLEGADTSRSFLFLNTWLDMRGDRLGDAAVLDRLVEAMRHPTVAAEGPPAAFNPYRGLEFFDEPHAPFFFGREAFIDDLFQRLAQARKSFVAVIGPSGSGKSSVVRAGLIPRLRRQRPPKETWDVAVFTPGDRPWFRLADALAPLRFPDKADADLDIEVDKLYRALEAGDLGLNSLLDRLLQRQGQFHRLLLVVDQFEELFTLTPAGQRPRFVQALVDALQVSSVVLVPTLRADFYGQAIDASRALSDLLGAEQVTLGRLTAEELRRAVVEPARRAHLEFDPGLPELLLRDAGNEPGNLPLLQYALLELYTRRVGSRLTSNAYEEIGGIRRAIATSAEHEYARLPDAQKTLVRSVFTQLVRLARADEGLEDTRRRVPVASLPQEAKGIVDEFTSARLRLLVKADARVFAADVEHTGVASEQETVEVAHEALIREWDRLKNWLNEDRGFYLWRQRLDQALTEYVEHGRQADYLLHSAALREAEGKLAGLMPEPLSPGQLDYIQASVDERERAEREKQQAEARAREEKEALEQREREALERAAVQAEAARQAEEQRRITAERGRRTLRYGALAMLAVALLAGYQWYRANGQRKEATAQTLALRTNVLHQKHNDTAAKLLAALSLQINPTQEAKDAAISLFVRQPFFSVPLTGHEGAVWSVAFSADGTRIVSGSYDKTLRLWDAHSGKPIGAPLTGHEGAVRSVVFSADGTRIVSGSYDKTLRLWDAHTGKLIGAPLTGHEGAVLSVAFSADGTRIVSGSDDKTLRLWDAHTGKPVGAPLTGHGGAVWSAAFSADGMRIVSGSADRTLRLWDAHTGNPIGVPFTGHKDAILSVAFSSDGTRIVSGSSDKTLRLWDARTGKPVGAPLTGHEGEVLSVAFSADGTRIVSGSVDKTLRLWDAHSGKPIGAALTGHESSVWSVAISADGTRIVSGSYDKTMRLWDADTGKPIGVSLTGHESAVWSIAISADGTRIVSGSWDETLRLWDAHTGKSIGAPLTGHKDAILSVALSADGTRIVSGSYDKTLRLWDAHTGKPIGTPLTGHEGAVWSVAFSADSTRIVSGSYDKTLRLWDTHTGKPIGAPLTGHEDEVQSVALSADGTRIVSGSYDKTLRLWDAHTGKPIGAPLTGHEEAVSSVAFSADGTRIVSGGYDKTLRLWDAHTGKPIGAPLTGHEEAVSSVAFSADGTRIVSGSGDKTLRLWDAHSGKPIAAPLASHEGQVRSVAFSADGTRIVSGSDDMTLTLWDAELIESGPGLYAVLCRNLHRNLTREEWKQYVPAGESYRKVCDNLPLEEQK